MKRKSVVQFVIGLKRNRMLICLGKYLFVVWYRLNNHSFREPVVFGNWHEYFVNHLQPYGLWSRKYFMCRNVWLAFHGQNMTKTSKHFYNGKNRALENGNDKRKFLGGKHWLSSKSNWIILSWHVCDVRRYLKSQEFFLSSSNQLMPKTRSNFFQDVKRKTINNSSIWMRKHR